MDNNTIMIEPEELGKYYKRCAIIKSLILKEYHDQQFEFCQNIDTRYAEIVINGTGKITILPDNSWTEIKRHIIKKIKFSNEKNKSYLCSICAEQMKKRVSCARCSNGTCGNCYINIFKANNGIIKCPHCRYSYGNHVPDNMIGIYIDEIKRKLGD